MNWITELPERDGRYVVKTESKYGGYFTNNHVLEATLHTNEKGQKSWSFKNQIFIAYLKE